MSDSDGSLSPEEIDALLQGTDDGAGGGDPFAGMDFGGGETVASASGLSPMEKGILEEQFNEAMIAAGSSAGALITKNITINNATIDEIPTSDIKIDTGAVNININLGSANSCLVFNADSAKKIAMLMFGIDDEPAELDEGHLSSLGELANTLIATLSKNLGPKFNDNLAPSVPDARIFKGNSDLPPFAGSNVLKITYNLSIDGLPSDKLVHYIDAANAEKWVKNFSNTSSAPADNGLNMMGGAPQQEQVSTGTPVNPVAYTNFPPSSVGSAPSQMPPNYELLLDVQMSLTVELGRTNKYVKDILSLGEGSIIELDKLAGEPVDLLINGKLIAKGEVVVIDENFGVRVTDIVGPAERLAQMTKN